MPTNYTGRVSFIVAILVVALLLIFPPSAQLFDRNLTLLERTSIKPGIDMVGGVSLIYQIQTSPGQDVTDLSLHTMEALKKRVDPQGVRNLVWRPQGNTRLEIQMPESSQSKDTPAIKKAFQQAQEELDATNVRSAVVIAAVEHLAPAQRDARLAELAGGSKTRLDLFKKLADTFDQMQTIRANKDNLPVTSLATKLEPVASQYETLKASIDDTNLTSKDFQDILDLRLSRPADGQKKLDDLKQKFADFPSRLKAMDDFVARYNDFQKVKNTVTDSADLKRLLQGSGVLEFHIMATGATANQADIQAMDARLQEGGKGVIPQPGDTMRWMEVDKVSEFDRPGQAPETREWNGKHYVLVLIGPDASMAKGDEKWGLEKALAQTQPDGGRAVEFSFNSVGGRLFGQLTEHWYNLTKNNGTTAQLAIVLDNKVISAPSLQAAITTGSGIITGGGEGGFSEPDLEYLVSTLNAGSLPAQLSEEPISETQIGSTIGADNLRKGLIACGFGLVVVAVFLIGYYYLAGVVAFGAVLMNLVLILGAMTALGATFTLPSIAGIVLTVGTAVDANVLIFERLREEQHRGLGLRMALRNSYERAFSAIVDSNMTSAITSAFLCWFGSEEVKGFGLTLLIGIAASLFTSLFVTKTVFGILIDKFGVKHLGSFPLSVPKWDRALRPNWDWMGKAWIFYTFSIFAIVIGLVLFAVKAKQGQMMDIEFASGTSVQFAMKENQPMKIEDVRALIDAQSQKQPDVLPSPSVITVGNDGMHYEVVTPNDNRPEVKAAVIAAMQGKLQLSLPSTFDLVNASVTDARDKAVLPIKDAMFSVDGFTPAAAADHVGGVAIVLRNLSPALTPTEIKSRLDNERSSASEGNGNIDYTVESPSGPDAKTNFGIVIGYNSSVAFSADEGVWSKELAEPLWALTNHAIDRKPDLEKETNFDPQVAGEMQRDAFLALTFSIAVIMAYIWVRFGNLKYGTATVVALLHDTIFTLAAMGFAHYIAQYWPNNFLEIQPFRINLTVVAGILTIMGYSMIDTIVVFDRIRENRGKYGHLDKDVINTAINETLSRTLLTAGTTIITVSFMYFLGGPGIHGFTFVLLVGILVGTYSSVAIAAPLLLVGKERATVGTTQPPLEQLQRA